MVYDNCFVESFNWRIILIGVKETSDFNIWIEIWDWHINSAHAPLKCDDGGLLPDAYLHLVRKKAAN